MNQVAKSPGNPPTMAQPQPTSGQLGEQAANDAGEEEVICSFES
jgi:hypothetical protein